MATLSSSGISGSGVDVDALVTQLMSVERKPITALNKTETSYQAKLTAYGTLKGSLASLQTAAAGLTSLSRFSSLAASAADSSILTATPGSTASTGNYSVEVKTLAQAHKISTDPATSPYASASAVVGSGTLTLQFGTYSGGTFTASSSKAAQSITIDSSHNTLGGIRDAINAANAGVTASVVNDGSAYRLVIGSNDSGTANSLKISVSDGDGGNSDNSGLSVLAYDPAAAAGSGKNMKETLAAKDATLTVDGIDITSSSNTVANAIDGVTLKLAKTNVGSPTTLAVTRNSSGVRSAIEEFVKAYNGADKTLKDLSAYDAANKKAAVLLGDATLNSAQQQLRKIMNTPLTTAGGGLTSLSDIGVSYQKSGTLTIDYSKLEKVISDPTKDISTLFAAVGKPSDSLVSFAAATSDTKSGSHTVNVTQLATRSTLTGTATTGTTVIGAANNSLGLSVDGVAASITLGNGTYTAASLAAEVQSKINGASALSSAGISVAVTAGSAGKLTGNSAVGTTSIDASNNQLDVTLGGVTRTVTLTTSSDRVAGGSADYTADTLAAELQTQINTAFAGDSKTATVSQSGGTFSLSLNNSFGSASNVSVTSSTGADNLFGTTPAFAGGSEMTLTSNRYGSASKLSLTASATATNLFGSATAGTTAVDVAGTINGIAATGSGQALTGASGDAKGLKVNIAGGSIGDRGTVKFAQGYAAQLDQALTRMLGTDGLLTSRTSGINSSVKSLDTHRKALEARMTLIEKRYRKQFSALDTTVTKLMQTQTALTRQLEQIASLSSSS